MDDIIITKTGHANLTRAGPTAATDGLVMPNASAAPTFTHRELPGPLSIARLSDFGTVHSLDQANAYSAEHADTLYGRGQIAQGMVPRSTIACALTAAWVWLGGLFPRTIDVLSNSHFRSTVHGRRIRAFSRKVDPDHVMRVGGLRVTTPLRTACDVSLLVEDEESRQEATEVLCALAEEYGITPRQCLAMLDENRHWPNTQQGRRLLESLEHCL
ncbi:sugar phosphate isomerase family [Bifidobacterium leontopitheci]|uniref:AbiEi antitoxin C-terminal domain-containing protein n=1 Tax=Bifidobacterium leontopitheci TaxID=2650774 RepID=A0A6I1GDV6_9BIFI|nr:hypothetical protein [Bifidobacterium leontopitheci]KAB7789823.1 hypothetical protein F7D09_1666 [Bifidobacterium leontopitheci]